MRERQPNGAPAHPDEDQLRTLAADGAADEAVRAHLAHCLTCARQVDELRRLRLLLHAMATDVEEPQRDVVGRTLARLRARQTALEQANELVATIASLLRALVSLLPGATHDGASPPSPRQDGNGSAREGGTTR
ncbi:MAG TPA: hypothetical protein VHB98_06545 [Chloroflexota bacterium]|jgi:hypothetical protein|nr:hypothetical protein [Chloroflexota bacterium]